MSPASATSPGTPKPHLGNENAIFPFAHKSAKAAKYYSEGVPAVLANPGLGVQCLNLSFGVGAGQRACVTVDLLGLCGACATTHGKSPIPLPLTLPRARPG